MTLTRTEQTRRVVPPVPHTDSPTECETRYAVSVLFAEHATSMLRVATVLLGDRSAAAEDVVQDAYLALYTSWPRIRDQQAAVGYLHRSVVNGVRSKQRRHLVADRYRPDVPRAAASAEETLLAASPGGPVTAAVRALPTREREVVLLRHYLDLSERETAEALGLRPGSVKAYSSRGLARLRADLLSDDPRSI
jgi:RNA polymerase sigma-70 factor (sigma-E family)